MTQTKILCLWDVIAPIYNILETCNVKIELNEQKLYDK